MFEAIEVYAEKIGHSPLIRFIKSSQLLHDRLGINAHDVEYDQSSGILRASLSVKPLHQGTAYGDYSIMYGIVIAAFADMFTGAAAYIKAGAKYVVNHAETRIRYTEHVHILEGTKIFTELPISTIKVNLRNYECNITIYQEHLGTRSEVATVSAILPSMLEKVFERILKRTTHL